MNRRGSRVTLAAVGLAASSGAVANEISIQAQFNNYITETVTAYVKPNTFRDVGRYGKETIAALPTTMVVGAGMTTFTLGFTRTDSMSLTYCDFDVDASYSSTGGTVRLTNCTYRWLKSGAYGASCSVRIQTDFTTGKCITDVDIR